jgi:hypothetical protein
LPQTLKGIVHQKRVVDADGNLRTAEEDAVSYLVGIRYLNRWDATFILEYYRNGTDIQKRR